ncbi:DUF305 domain-containing protein [[Clostridium] dakarense]|uniref:DUF305 domain-containing protein n=1 Tax=Faecalimicrobium dakarense TaxID=1301100 RepID=UPI0004B852C2|nr:DUF305 domain-containing protein [[Clostridium] dakarense]
MNNFFKKLTIVSLATLMVILTTVACSKSYNNIGKNENIKVASNIDNDTNNKKRDYIKVYNDTINKMNKGMSGIVTTGDINLDYLYGMIIHHQGAIEMSENLLKYEGQNSQVKQLAENIINAQIDSIIKMNAMIDDLSKSPVIDETKEESYLKEYNKALKNMMDRFSKLELSENIDRNFLQGMIIHHQGAIDIVNAVLKYSDNDDIKAMAKEEAKSQEPQIDEMKKIIDLIR